MAVEREVGERRHAFHAGDVEPGDVGNAACGADGACQRYQLFDAPRAEDDAVALRGKKTGGGFTDTAAGARDEDDFRCVFHAVLPGV